MLELKDRELIRWCGEVGTGVVSYSPLGVGFLTGRYTREEAQRIDDWRATEGWLQPERLDRVFEVVEGIRPIAERAGISTAQLALAWNWHQPGVTSAIAGSRSATHTASNAGAGDIQLDDATLAEVEALLAAP